MLPANLTRSAGSPGLLLTWVLVAATIGTNIAWILASATGRITLTLLGVVLFAAASMVHAWTTRGPIWTVRFAAITVCFGFLIEWVGSATGFPFGAYSYTELLGWNVAGVPVAVPLAWLMMAYPVWLAASRTFPALLPRFVLATALLATWDLFLDPQMVAEGYWRWAATAYSLPGSPDIPLSNYLGWWLAAAILCGLLTLWSKTLAEGPADLAPAVQLAWVYVGSVVANAVFLQRPLVGLMGGVGMGIPIAIWLWRGQPFSSGNLASTPRDTAVS